MKTNSKLKINSSKKPREEVEHQAIPVGTWFYFSSQHNNAAIDKLRYKISDEEYINFRYSRVDRFSDLGASILMPLVVVDVIITLVESTVI